MSKWFYCMSNQPVWVLEYIRPHVFSGRFILNVVHMYFCVIYSIPTSCLGKERNWLFLCLLLWLPCLQANLSLHFLCSLQGVHGMHFIVGFQTNANLWYLFLRTSPILSFLVIAVVLHIISWSYGLMLMNNSPKILVWNCTSTYAFDY